MAVVRLYAPHTAIKKYLHDTEVLDEVNRSDVFPGKLL
jgi:hypothetical protein